MKVAIVSNKDVLRLGRMDAPHIIACVEHGGDIMEAHRFITATTNKKGYGIMDVINRAKELL